LWLRVFFFVQRAATFEREVEQLRQQLAAALNSGSQSTGSQQQTPPDMEYAIDILKRSSLEVELAAKEKEACIFRA
jgi:homeobox protein cut-like